MNNKVNGVANLGVEVIKDLEVERAKEKSNNPIKRTFDDTFGNGQPVKAGAFVGKLISSTIDIEAEKWQVRNSNIYELCNNYIFSIYNIMI